MWKVLGHPEMTAQLKQTIIEGVLKEAADRSVDELEKERDEMLLGLLSVRAKSANPSTSAKKGG